jgi:hypothetical protein
MMNDRGTALMRDASFELRRRASEAIGERAEHAQGTPDWMFQAGRVMAFNEAISLIQQTALGLGIPLSDLGLADIEPDRDLV